MMTPSMRDVENLSAFLDGQLSKAEQTRLEARLRSEPALAAAFEDLRQARQLLRRTPRRAVPRNFTLTPKMAGIRPPVPRVIPALSWASAVAMLVFIFSVGSNLFGQLLYGAGAPMLAAAPMSAEGSGGYGVGGGPQATPAPGADNALTTPTPEILLMAAPQATTPGETSRVSPPPLPAEKAAPEAVINWPFLWLGLALVLIATALLVRLLNIRAFRRKTLENQKH